MQGDQTPDKKKSELAMAETGSQAGDSGSAAADKNVPEFPDDATVPSLSQRDIDNISKPAVAGGDRSLIGEIIENYRIISVLGKGGMSVVYKAGHIELNKTVAIKTMHSHLISDNSALLRFKQEAQAASQLSHPHVINVYSFGTTSGDNPQPYIIMDYIEGDSLSDAVRKKGLLPVRNVLQIFKQVCSALAHAHSKGVIHRDLKPSNIMLLAPDDDVKIVDFGIAKLLPQEGEQAHRLTQTGEIFGSPMYMSPEQCMGQVVDKRSDIYSLGCVLYESLSGKPPHMGGNVFETFNKHTSEIPAPLDIPGAEKNLVERLDAVVFRALEKQPEKRYQSMTDFENELSSIEAEMDSGLRSTGLGHGIARQQRTLRRFIRSFPKAVALFILIACLLSATAFYSWQRYSWFLEPHDFQPTASRWFYFLQARRKPNMSLSEKQNKLDQGMKALKITRLVAGDTAHWLELWQSRARECAKLDSPKDEIEARREVLKLEKEINGESFSAYGLAAEELAECLISQADYKAAIPLLEDALSIRERLDLKSPKINILLGYAYGRSGQIKNSKNQLDRAIKLLKNEDYRLLALAYSIRADQGAALAALDKNQAKYALAGADRDYAEALKVLTESGKNKNLMNEITLMRAYVNMEAGEFKKACSFYAVAMPYAEKQFSDQAGQMQQMLDAYAYSCWRSGDIIKAGELHARSAALGNTTNTGDSEAAIRD